MICLLCYIMSTWTDYCKQACSEYMPSGSVMVCATYRTARWRQSHAALISQMRAKQNEQHGAVVCSNYDLLYLQPVSYTHLTLPTNREV